MKKKYYDDEEEELDYQPVEAYNPKEQQFGCQFCWDDKKKKEFEIYFFDRANNMRICNYCPYCGRKFGE